MDSNVNFSYSIGYVVTAALGFFNLGYTFSYFNNIMELMYTQYKQGGIIVTDDKDSFNFFINALIPFSAILGAPIGWKLSTHGRRRGFQIVSCVMSISCAITIIENFYTLVIGRIIMGICCGCYVTLIPLVVSEVSPGCIGGPLGVVGQVMTVSGIFMSITSGFAVPYEGDANELTSNIWRVLMIFPAIIAAIQFCLFKFIYTLDTPVYYLLQGDKENYFNIMGKLYKDPKKAGAISLLEEEDKEVELAPSVKSVEMTWTELLFGKYRKGVAVGVVLGFFHQATGISMVTFLSQDIFVKGFEGIDRQYHARLGTFGVGIAGLLGGICGLIASQFYGRKQIINTGCVFMCVLYGLLCNFALIDNQRMTIHASILFVFVFNSTFGSMLWLYVSEILGAKGISVVAFVNLTCIAVFARLGNLFYQFLSPAGVYLWLIFLQVGCIMYTNQNMLETRGTTSAECNSLYLPKETQDENTKVEMKAL